VRVLWVFLLKCWVCLGLKGFPAGRLDGDVWVVIFVDEVCRVIVVVECQICLLFGWAGSMRGITTADGGAW
jgi:hypothetical protein